ncbi:hypothetical protein E2C01_069347 [Portunus trituberculatus]|uniref:Uncharacterized protein n=1 Tax=Portunus trituberculatus TaxID=210409 RepID=A0A5B7I2I9_PORTR|nr:hypothetical protein [Portunus trituberculatus]
MSPKAIVLIFLNRRERQHSLARRAVVVGDGAARRGSVRPASHGRYHSCTGQRNVTRVWPNARQLLLAPCLPHTPHLHPRL